MQSVLKILVFCVIVCTGASGQESSEGAYVMGSKNIQLTMGAGVIGVSGNPWRLMVPPMKVEFTYGVHDLFSVGAIAGVARYHHTVSQRYDWRIREGLYHLGLQGRLHLFNLGVFSSAAARPTMDPYIGALAGYTFNNLSEIKPPEVPYDLEETENHPAVKLNNRFQWGVFLGSRFYISDMIALVAEIGPSFGIVNLGVSLKF